MGRSDRGQPPLPQRQQEVRHAHQRIGNVQAVVVLGLSALLGALALALLASLVAGFVRATIKGVLDTIKDPDAAIKSVMSRNETGDPKIELDRLKMSLRDNFVTPWVKANGFGGVDMAADLRCKSTWMALQYARSRVVHAAAAAGETVLRPSEKRSAARRRR